MGEMEKKSAKRKKRRDIQHLILSTIAVAGVLSVALVAPNVVGAMDKLGLLPNRRQNEIIKASRERLLKKGYLVRDEGKLRLTSTGQAFLLRLQLRHSGLRKPKRWDGRWRLLIFDIPEQRKGQRDLVRRTLIQIGFVRLQDSVWLYPYDCEDIIVLLKADFRIGKNLLYIIADTIENDTEYRALFNLPLDR
ncbi:hypothetical protein C4568_00380 [Candidatus Parcubacteria bacterium]|nr:MAG: hypothetical protein C4568_00380 [Candidatus Parcubacteria bacterium]